MCQTAEGATEEITNMLQRMRTLALQSANGTNADSERTAIQEETDQLSLEIQRIGEQTSFGGTLHLLDGSLGAKDDTNKANGKDGLVSFQVGSHSDQTVTAKFSDLTFGGLVNYVAGKKEVASGSTISFAGTAANTTGQAMLRNIADKDKDGLKGSNVSASAKAISGTNVEAAKTAAAKLSLSMTSQANAQAAVKVLDAMISHVDSERAQWGAVQNRLTSTISNQSNTITNVSDARSRIQDVLSQANSSTQIALSLLG